MLSDRVGEAAVRARAAGQTGCLVLTEGRVLLGRVRERFADRSVYLDDPDVQGFLAWMTPYVTGERAFRHEWHSPKWGAWSCESLFVAYRRFNWHVCY